MHEHYQGVAKTLQDQYNQRVNEVNEQSKTTASHQEELRTRAHLVDLQHQAAVNAAPQQEKVREENIAREQSLMEQQRLAQIHKDQLLQQAQAYEVGVKQRADQVQRAHEEKEARGECACRDAGQNDSAYPPTA